MDEIFKFIESEALDKNVTKDYIDELENKMNIKFPGILKEFYLKYNFSNQKECCFKIEGLDAEFILDCIIPLKYGTMPLEKAYEWVLKDEYLSNELIPLAQDMYSDLYYWHSQSSKVYYISHENIENPILICNSVDEFFEILNKCSDETITIPNLNRNSNTDFEPKEYNLHDTKVSIDVSKILKYNGKFLLICILIGIFLTIISLFFDDIFKLLSFVFGIYTLIFIIIDIINRIKSNNVLKKYDINILKKELETAIKLDGIDTYLTDNYIISNTKTIKITKYSDIEWVFIEKATGTASQQSLISSSYWLGGTPILAYLTNGKKVVVALVKNSENVNMIFNRIRRKNNSALIGNTLENRKKYKNSIHKTILDSNKITWIILFIMIIVVTIINKYWQNMG